MNESFKLLSSMSPKCNQKTVTKVKVLALNRHVRRSSIYAKIPTIRNENLVLVDGSTNSSSNSKSKLDVTASKVHDVIVINSSSDNEGEDNKQTAPLYNDNRSKTSRIQKWLAEIEAEDKGTLTQFSQVSTIYGDVALNENGCAIQSTFIDPATRRFDELFKTNSVYVNKETDDAVLDKSDVSLELQFDISLRSKLLSKSTQNADRNKKELMDLTPQLSMDKTKDQFKTIRRRNNKYNDTFEPSNIEAETLLDTLYGTKWRDKHEQVLPQTEPRKGNHSSTYLENSLYHRAATDRKIINCKKKTLQPKSPWMDKFKEICDSETDSDDLNIGNRVNVRTRLEFDSDCDSDNNLRIQNKGKGSPLSETEGESLEDIIQKKLNSIFLTPKVNPLSDSNKNDNSKHNEDNKARMNNKKLKHKENVKPTGDREYATDNKKKIKSRNLGQDDKIQNTKKFAVRTGTVSSSSSRDFTEDSNSPSSDDDFDKEVTRIVESRKRTKKPSSETCSFLESLSGQVPLLKCDAAAKIFRTSYKHYRDELVKKLFNLYNDKVFEGIIPRDTAINWNHNLRGTAGLCHCKRITHRNGKVERIVSISLSSKVLDSPDRVRDTLIHEMCHAAVWIVNMVSNGHGPYWKKWALHAMTIFPELPPIKRCHSYVINTKYTYRCQGCGQTIGRHSKSLNIERKRCGLCYGKFEILINKTTKNGETKTVPVTPKREPSQFALFVKENYALYKEPSRKHGDVMKILGQKFAELKVQTA
ncbi:germ cell nuclear acidic protein-like isoform X2 [Cylas formicarius]|uniref:germ cell nuclear acidic protein-like isoform X2 n=1 Tax=Cylas formicarius TaxID=197179 RepID=UPI002958D338|nr:germ cell nuclear acidic protein-like isoform X2 [Cylas formicarius]